MHFRDYSDTIIETPEIEAHLRAGNEVIAGFKTFEEVRGGFEGKSLF